MELVTDLNNNQFSFFIPVIAVLLGVIGIYVFSIKSTEQPAFDKLSVLDDRKPAGKKRKTKEKKTTANGHATNVSDSKSDKSPAKEIKRSPVKELTAVESVKQQKEKKQETNAFKQAEKKMKIKTTVEELKNKKNLKVKSEKPVDFDDGAWETVISKNDKKTRKAQETISPLIEKTKKSKKEKKEELILTTPDMKSVKDEVNKDLKEKEKIVKEKSQKEKIVKDKKVEKPVAEKIIEVVLTPAAELENFIHEEAKSKKKAKKAKANEEVIEIPEKNSIKKEAPVIRDVTPKKDVPKKEAAIKKELVSKIDTAPKKEKIKGDSSPKKEGSPKKEIVKTESSPKKDASTKIEATKEPAKKEKKKAEAATMTDNIIIENKADKAVDGTIAFDELGDVWTEAKAAKKNKKKARKDN